MQHKDLNQFFVLLHFLYHNRFVFSGFAIF